MEKSGNIYYLVTSQSTVEVHLASVHTYNFSPQAERVPCGRLMCQNNDCICYNNERVSIGPWPYFTYLFVSKRNLPASNLSTYKYTKHRFMWVTQNEIAIAVPKFFFFLLVFDKIKRKILAPFVFLTTL